MSSNDHTNRVIAWFTARGMSEAHARYYLFRRLIVNRPMREALARTMDTGIAAINTQQYYESAHGPVAGAPYKRNKRSSETLRWVSDASAACLRFVGFADEIYSGIEHNGWLTHPDGVGATYRGAVWRLAGHKGYARLVYGYVESENPGAAVICVSNIESVKPGDDGPVFYGAATRDYARYGDNLAEREAKTEREYQEAWQQGVLAACLNSDITGMRKQILIMCKDWRGAGKPDSLHKLVRDAVETLLAVIADNQTKRENLWGECASSQESAFLEGFGDVEQAIMLGWIKP